MTNPEHPMALAIIIVGTVWSFVAVYFNLSKDGYFIKRCPHCGRRVRGE